jgi:hypothetical protein
VLWEGQKMLTKEQPNRVMSKHKGREKLPGVTDDETIEPKLKRTDRAVLKYLRRLARQGDGETCKASISKIAAACEISPRQVTVSTGRLAHAELIERVKRDFHNSDPRRRGTVYRLLSQTRGHRDAEVQRVGKTKTINLFFLSITLNT